MEFLREHLQALGKKRQLLGVHGFFTGLGRKYKAFYQDDIADIHLLEILIGFLADGVSGDVDLQIAQTVADIAERSLAHDAFKEHASGQGNGLSLQFIISFSDLGRVMRDFRLGDAERIFARSLQLGELIPADLSDLVEVLCLISFSFVLSCHA